jgi:ribosome recycling factor
MLNNLFADADSRMTKGVKKLASDLAKVRTGRASLSIFEGVTVDYYGTPTPISQVAGISNPEPSMITIQPWDASILSAIERSILAANLGFTPSNDGSMIRISIPPLTEERRKEYAKQAHQLGEQGKNVIRNVRRDVNDSLKKMEKAKEISQDEMRRGLDEIQKLTDQQIKKIDSLVADKEKEIMSF